jgi:hypothetical protein
MRRGWCTRFCTGGAGRRLPRPAVARRAYGGGGGGGPVKWSFAGGLYGR